MGDFIFIAQKDESGKAQTASRKKTAVLTVTKHQPPFPSVHVSTAESL